MRTMREERIFAVLQDLSSRVAEMNTTMQSLIDDFSNGRRASMQIRKAARKCMAMADIVMCRFLAIASANHIDEDWAIFKTFHARRVKFNELELFFH